MRLVDLKKHVDLLVERGHGNDVVLLTLSDNSICARASCEIVGIFSGIDWETGQVRIEPEKKIVSYRKDRDRPLMSRKRDYTVGTRVRHLRMCPKCENHLRKDDNFCSCCGQAIARED